MASLQSSAEKMELRAIRISDLATGMVLQEDVRTSSGLLIVVCGQEITVPLIATLKNFRNQKAISDRVLVLCPCVEKAPA